MPRYLLSLGAIILAWSLVVADLSPSAEPVRSQPVAVEKYVLNYPGVQQFCPPVESYFDDVAQTIQSINGHVIRHPLGGGYGLPVVLMAGDQHLLHLGADVSWMRPGAPVYAIANGVVRMSMAPAPNSDHPGGAGSQKGIAEQGQGTRPDEKPKPSGAPAQHKPLGWGNLLVVEHRLLGGDYATSVYGHLAKRLVSVGDVVQAGQVIGFVGKKGIENGGYDPHLHFAVRSGRMFEPGVKLLSLRINGVSTDLKISNLGEDEVEIETDESVPFPTTIAAPSREFSITTREGKHFLPAAALNRLKRPGFAIVGYGLKTEGWREPTEFLREMRADTYRAPFLPAPKGLAAKPRD